MGEERGEDLILHKKRERDILVSLQGFSYAAQGCVCILSSCCRTWDILSLEREVCVPDVLEPCLHAAALAPPFPTRFIECREFYEALPEPVSHRSPGKHTPSITAAFPQQN